MAKNSKAEAKGGEVLSADQISALNAALTSAKSEGQDIGKLSVAEITSLLTMHANSIKVAEAAIPKKFKLLKNHGLVASGKTSTFYEAGTVFDSIEHRDLIGTLVRDGAQVEEIQPIAKKESAGKKTTSAPGDGNASEQDAGTEGDSENQQEQE